MNLRIRLCPCLCLIAASILSWAESAPACAPAAPVARAPGVRNSPVSRTSRPMTRFILDAAVGALGAAITVGLVGRVSRRRWRRRSHHPAARRQSPLEAGGRTTPVSPAECTGSRRRHRERRFHFDRFYVAMLRDL
jgi:hypothetical protein